MHLPTSVLVAAVTLGLSSVTEAVCAGYDLAIGTGTIAGTNRHLNIYNTACAVINTYEQPASVAVCDSAVFLCTFGTATIEQYDDPVTGWAYNATVDTTAEACGSDIIISCGAAFWGQEPDGSPLNS